MPRGIKKWWYFWPLVLNLMKTTNRSLSGLYPCPATDISSCGFDSTVSLLSGIGNHKTQAPMQKAHPDCGSFPRFLKALPTWAKDETDPTVCFWRGWGGSNLITKGNCPFFFLWWTVEWCWPSYIWKLFARIWQDNLSKLLLRTSKRHGVVSERYSLKRSLMVHAKFLCSKF